ncbi:MAG: DUF1549 domain-containing protein, partial [Planctomycetaceae bacterium]|nr:DUF1549 domain-containing protein [Planctomycetaceae bacterium]
MTSCVLSGSDHDLSLDAASLPKFFPPPESDLVVFRVSCIRPAALAALLLWCSAAAGPAADIRFNRDIRPVLSARCVKCHGPDDAHREADLRLDTEAGIRQAFSGNLENSSGWERISSTDPDLVMPPPDSHSELEPAEREALRIWISDGGQWEGHWSFIPPVSAEVPWSDDVSRQTLASAHPEVASWIRNPIDAFVLRRLLDQGLIPNQDADRERLLRRVTLDLTGLPPTVAELDAFLADDSADAYEHAVD